MSRPAPVARLTNPDARAHYRRPEDDIAAIVTREELAEITRGYRRVAGFEVDTLNRKSDETRELREAVACSASAALAKFQM